MKRPLRSRIWFYRPELYWYGWKTLRPFWFGDDEYHWKTVVLGWNLFGQVVFAMRPFRPKECEVADCIEFMPAGYPGWPIAIHDWPEPFDYGEEA
jgi:hypothetical protein